jgi:hypothetical protein
MIERGWLDTTRRRCSYAVMAKFAMATVASIALGVGVGVLVGCNAGGMEITPVSSVQSNDLGFVGGQPADGDLFIFADLKLANTGTVPLPLAGIAFTITSTDGVQYLGGGFTDMLADGCKTGQRLASGGAIECKVMFTAPAATRTKTISYKNTDDPNAPTVEVPFTTTPCTVCGTACVDTSTDPANCGACGQSAGAGTCVKGKVECDGTSGLCDGMTCTSLLTDSANCGACGNPVPPGHTCVDGQPTDMATLPCKDLPTCAGDGTTPTSGCVECSGLGDANLGTDGGSCNQAYVNCLGSDGHCQTGGDPGCCSFFYCIRGCDKNPQDHQINDFDEEDCVCTHNATPFPNGCTPISQEPPGPTCFAKAKAAGATFQSLLTWQTLNKCMKCDCF